ncbi:MAG: VWA domain-containing protein [Planctomycetes bacterium]|nr:VWA domain-containing protein [Planctomycetota bacterium]
MSLLSPLAGLVLLASVVVPLVSLYVLRLHRERRTVSSTLAWERRTEDLRANVPFQRLRPSLLLLLQLLLLALLALAVAQPVLRGLGTAAGRTILMIDASASMATRDEVSGQTRLERARALAVERARALQGGGLLALSAPEIMVIAFAQSPQVVVPFTTSLARIEQGIEAVSQTDERTCLAPALELARAHQAGRRGEDEGAASASPAVIELFSDGAIGDAAEATPRGRESVVWSRVGRADTANTGLSAAGCERAGEDADGLDTFAALRNFGATPAGLRLELRAGSRVVAVTPQPVQVPGASATQGAGERRVVFADLDVGSERLLRWTVSPGDALAADDVAHAVVRQARPLRLALVGQDDSLRSLLEALSPASLVTLDVAGGVEAMRKDPGWADGFDAVVWVGDPPAAVDRGRWLLFGRPPAMPGLHPFGEPGRDFARAWRTEHPTLRQCNLNELVVQRVHRLAAESGWTTLIEGGRSPLALAGRTGAGFAIVCPFEPGDSNWPFQRSFVNFTAQSLELLAGLGEVAGETSIEPGEMIRVRLPDRATQPMVQPPLGAAEPMVFREGEAAWGPARRAGAYRISWTDARGQSAERWVAVNLLDEAECRVAAPERLSLGGQRIEAGGGSTTLEIWPFALALAVALLLLEWWVYHQRAAR